MQETLKLILPPINEVKDFRINRRKLYTLSQLLLAAVFAVMRGANSWNNVAREAKAGLPILRKVMPYKNGVPSHDTFNRVFQGMDPAVFEKMLLGISHALMEKDGLDVASTKFKVNVLRASDKAGENTIQTLILWVEDLQATLGHKILDDNSADAKAQDSAAK